ncbi:hypothetical protein GGS20DRAFT_340517 [Poronia punctata]|nr:hypothetical protein GGS20DRAFT_340517 [Poronia punctata]
MLLGYVIGGLYAVVGVSSTSLPTRKFSWNRRETCTTHLLIDDFSTWSEGLNNLQGATSDDSTFNSTDTSGGNLTFIPNGIQDSYVYEQFNCTDTIAQGYDSISFTIKGPEAASVSLELQTQRNCSDTEYQSYYYTVDGLIGSPQTVVIPLNSWDGANLKSVVGVLWYGFSAGITGQDTVWQLDDVRLLCAGVAPPVTTPPPASDPDPDPDPGNGDDGGDTTVTVTVTSEPTPTSGWPWDPWPPPWDDDDHDDDRQQGEEATISKRATDTEEVTAACDLTLVDDWASQSRLTFLYYNAMLKPSSDDGTMRSVSVSSNKLTLTPSNTDSYFYSQLGCFDARSHGGISLRITAAAGTSLAIQLSSSRDDSCNGESTKDVTLTSDQLGWTFTGKEKLYSIPFSKFSGLDYSKFSQIILSGLSRAVTIGPVALYCGTGTVTEYIAPPIIQPSEPTATVPAPSSTTTAKPFVIDAFSSSETNALSHWHGTEDEGLKVTYRSGKMTLQTSDPDLSWVTQVSETCLDMSNYASSYLHIAYTGSNKFTVALQQHNTLCDNNASPYPETWDSLEASRYSTSTDIYIPLSHFSINLHKTVGIALKGFWSPSTTTTISRIEIVNSIPAGFKIPTKLPSGKFVFACTRPNSFAFAIDDGDPVYAQRIMEIIETAGFKATFFTVGAPLLDPSTNLSAVYREMAARGHQIALHSYTHPALEGLPDEAAIDWEYTNDFRAVEQTFGGNNNNARRYFRPPFGTEGARMRQRYAALVPDPYIVQWSVDVEDWLWAGTDTPEKQIDAFRRDVAAGGSITVMHYLYESTVSYLPQFIEIAKASGKQLMRVDQCMMDPNAPPL